MLTQNGCLARQDRWRAQMKALKLDATAVLDYRDVYYFTGAYIPPHLPGTPVPLLLLMFADGENLLFIDSASAGGGFDARIPEDGAWGVAETLAYAWGKNSTTNPDHTSLLVEIIEERLEKHASIKRLGFQYESMPWMVARAVVGSLRPEEFSRIDAALGAQQAHKDADEIACIRESIRIARAGYDAAKAVIAPGVTELEVLDAARSAAIKAAGELVYLNGDFRSGEMGGFARSRKIEAGESYIIDLWVYHHGYWSDMARTFAVGGDPSPEQRSLFDHFRGILDEVPRIVKPGMDGREVFALIDNRVRSFPALREIGLIHHAGHALGLRAHELPDLNPDRGGAVEPGCVFTIEPGGYPADAKGGVRLENVYLMTESGVENLSPHPFEYF
jgi:Xaa-Pro aminopeptidase